MKEIERINKQMVEFAKILIKVGGHDKFLDEIINRDQPTQPEGYQGLNKWYKCNNIVFYCTKKEDYYLYGCGCDLDLENDKCWLEFCTMVDLNYKDTNLNLVLATPTEIQQAILKGCEQKGIVKGAKVLPFNYLVDNLETLFEEVDRKGSYCIKNSDGYYVRVFDNGKFAEVVKEEKEPLNQITDEEFFKQAPKNNEFNTKPSDKELLKECSELLYNLYNGIWNGEKISPFLTKLNKHLNHE